MTANVGKGGNGRSGQRSTGAGGKSDKRKTTSAAKSPRDEVTVKKTDDTAEGGRRFDDAEETAVDFAVTKDGAGDGGRDGTEDTVQDIKLPDRKAAADPTGDAAGSKDRLVSRGAKGDPTDTTRPESHEPAPAPDGSTVPDIPAPGARYPTADGAADPSASPYGSVTTPSYGSVGALEPAARPAAAGDTGRPERSTGRKAPRKAHLQVARFEPWSVMKFSFIMSLVCFLVLFVAVAVLWVILSGLGVFDALTHTIQDLQGKSSDGLNPASWFSAAHILGYTALIGTLNVLLITALATVWSVIYNMASDLVGGVEVTLKEAE